jgi:hypothetical protein
LVKETDNRSRLLCVCLGQKGRTAERGQEIASPHVAFLSQGQAVADRKLAH